MPIALCRSIDWRAIAAECHCAPLQEVADVAPLWRCNAPLCVADVALPVAANDLRAFA
jgi:hypothetical protein